MTCLEIYLLSNIKNRSQKASAQVQINESVTVNNPHLLLYLHQKSIKMTKNHIMIIQESTIGSKDFGWYNANSMR